MHKYINVKTFKSRYWYIQIAALFFAGLILTVWFFTKEQLIPDNFLVPQKIVTFKDSKKVNGIGVITPFKQRFIAAPDDGQIVELFVRQGQNVDIGTPILRIENVGLQQEAKIANFELLDIKSEVELKKSELGITRYQLESNLSNAQAVLESQKLSLDASAMLVETGIISKIKFEQEKIAIKQALLDVESRKNQLVLFEKSYLQQIKALDSKIQSQVDKQQYYEKRLAALTIESDITGSIRNLSFNTGQSVSQGQNLVELVDTKTLVVEVQIPQYSANSVAIGNSTIVKTPTATLSAKVDYIDSVIRNGAARVYVKFNEGVPSWLKIDQSVEVTIETSEDQMITTLEKPLNFEEYDNWTVYRILDNKVIVKTDISLIINGENTLTLNSLVPNGETVFIFPTLYANQEQYPIPLKKF